MSDTHKPGRKDNPVFGDAGMDSLPDAVFICNDRGIITYWNAAAERLFGYPRAKAEGKDLTDLLVPSWYRSQHRDKFPFMRRTGRCEKADRLMTVPAVTQGGGEISVELSLSMIPEKDGNGVVVSAREVQARTEDIKRLETSEQKYRHLYDMAPDMLFTNETGTGRIKECNQLALETFGYTREEMLTKTVFDLAHPDDRDRIKNRLMRDFQITGRIENAEVKGLTRNGDVLDLLVNVIGKKNRDGSVIESYSVVRDLTGIRKVQREKREAEARYEMVTNAANVIVWEFQWDTGRFTFVSPTARDVTGWPLSEWTKPGFWQNHIHPKDRDTAVNYCIATTEKGEDHSFEYRMVTADGGYIWVRDIVHVVPFSDSPHKLMGILVDITETRQAEEESHRMWELLEKSDNEIYIFDAGSFAFLRVNHGGRNNLGYTMDELLAMNALDIKPDFDKKSFEELLAPLRNGDTEMLVYETVHKRKDGTTYPVEVRLQASSFGNRPVFIAIILDIAERKKAEAVILQNQRELTIRNRIANVFITDNDEELYNEVLQIFLKETRSRFGYFGYINDNGDLVCPSMTRDIWEVCQIPDKEITFPREKWGGLWGRSLIEMKFLISNENLKPPPGHIPLSRALAAPITYENRVIGQVALANKETDYTPQDIDLVKNVAEHTIAPLLHGRLERQREEEQKMKALEELKAAKEDAENANDLKDKFVSLVAHDLKSPITSINGLLHLVREKLKPAEDNDTLELIDRVERAGESMVNIVDKVLSISRLQSGKLQPMPRFLDAYEVVLNAISLFTHLADNKDISIINEVPQGTRIFADPELFGQVIQNLLSNAIKFSPQGKNIEMFVPEGHSTAIAVKDEGRGIDPAVRDDLFRHDVKTSRSGTAGETGTGLGLPLSLDIMKEHKGTITLTSDPGRGSTFIAELPFVQPVVLAVDDDDLFLAELEHLLMREGASVVKAGNAKEALGRIAGITPHLVITDLVMPEVDGFEFIRTLKKSKAASGAGIIAVTGNSELDTKTRAFSAGADDYVIKPISPAEFLPRVRRFIG